MLIEQSSSLGIKPRSATEFVDAPYFSEEIRRQLMDRFGADRVYGGGLSVRTSIDPNFQLIAEKALQYGLMKYDKRHGWRGAIKSIPLTGGWDKELRSLGEIQGALASWRLAVVIKVTRNEAKIGFENGEIGSIKKQDLLWAREWRPKQRLGKKIISVQQVLSEGDIIFTEVLDEQKNTHKLQQIPDVNGAAIALDPHTGRVLALSLIHI